MNNVSKTLYIPLYGKALVSKKGIILNDKKAEEIWNKEGFSLKGKSKSKWLAYFMGMRSAVFDNWLSDIIQSNKDLIILHIGCGMDSRCERVNSFGHSWFDIDFPEVISERRKYFSESESYHMLAGDARSPEFLSAIPKSRAVIVLEGICMYLKPDETKHLLAALSSHFESISVLMDCYTTRSAKASKYKNPINDVGVNVVYGVDDSYTFESDHIGFVKEHDMTPAHMINLLQGMERFIFKNLFAGKFAKSMYRMYEYKSR